ncbi:MAG: hypothetical protein REI78_13445 [Pedobacter sp.]|nr:hypothetical protein [Pedobacter sp.]MDQ8054033.1 hypothetical protein [Pedobacter sp.]
MRQEDLFRKLGLILKELNEQYEFLAENPQQLSELELELFQANANFLADHVQIIKKINLNGNPVQNDTVMPSLQDEQEEPAFAEEESQLETVTFDEPSETEENEVVEPAVPQLDLIEEEVFKLDQSPSTFEFILNDHSEHERFEFEEKSVDELFNRPLSEAEEQILAQKMKLREKMAMEADSMEDDEIGPEPFLVTAKPVPVEEEQTAIVQPDEAPAGISPEDLDLEKPKVNHQEPVEDPNYKPTLNELLAKGNENINAVSRPAIKDLKQAISLNDKLLYIKDLFNGYNLAYAEAIEVANKLPNFEAADNFFQKNYAVKNNWAEKQATVDQFYSLLNQRFK